MVDSGNDARRVGGNRARDTALVDGLLNRLRDGGLGGLSEESEHLDRIGLGSKNESGRRVWIEMCE